MLVNWYGLDGLSLHVHIPDLYSQIVAREDISAIVGESDVGYGGDDFGEEGARRRVFFLLELYSPISYVDCKMGKGTHASHVDRTKHSLSCLPA
jgi:hypothetical protein